LSLGPEGYSPALVKKIARQGGRDSFAEARQELQEHEGLEIHPARVQEITERIGKEWAEHRDREVERFVKNELPRLHGRAPAVAAVMVDGGKIQVRAEGQSPGVHKPEWREPKYGCCLTLDTPESKVDPQPDPPSKFLDHEKAPRLAREMQHRAGIPASRKPETRKGSSPSRRKKKRKHEKKTVRGSGLLVRTVVASMKCSQAFGFLLAAEVYLRSLDRARRKGYVCDGQAYNWTIFEEHFRRWGFIPILDFLHLLSHLYAAAQAAGGGERTRWGRYERWLRQAWGGQRERLLAELIEEAERAGSAPKEATETDPRRVLEETQRYVANNLERMDYPRYRKLGLPISSAPMESVVKQFNRRVKGTEKFWTNEGAEAVLQIRAAYLSQDDRAERFWSMPRPPYRAVGRNRLAIAG
jgi:hypothetical protein